MRVSPRPPENNCRADDHFFRDVNKPAYSFMSRNKSPKCRRLSGFPRPETGEPRIARSVPAGRKPPERTTESAAGHEMNLRYLSFISWQCFACFRPFCCHEMNLRPLSSISWHQLSPTGFSFGPQRPVAEEFASASLRRRFSSAGNGQAPHSLPHSGREKTDPVAGHILHSSRGSQIAIA